jgi:hypothetical protein
MENQRSPETFVVKIKMTYVRGFKNYAVSTPQLNHKAKLVKDNLTSFTIRDSNYQTPILVSFIPVTACGNIKVDHVSSEGINRRLFIIQQNVGVSLQNVVPFR